MLARGVWQSRLHNTTYGEYYKDTKLIGYWSASNSLVKELRAIASPEYDM